MSDATDLTPQEQAQLAALDSGIAPEEVAADADLTAAIKKVEEAPPPAPTPVPESAPETPPPPTPTEQAPTQVELFAEKPPIVSPAPLTEADKRMVRLETDLKAANDGKADLGRELAQNRRDLQAMRGDVRQLGDFIQAESQRRTQQQYELQDDGRVTAVQPAAQQPADLSQPLTLAQQQQLQAQAHQQQATAFDAELQQGYNVARAQLTTEQPERAAAFATLDVAFPQIMSDLVMASNTTGFRPQTPEQAILLAQSEGLDRTWAALHPTVPWQDVIRFYNQRNIPAVVAGVVDKVRGINPAAANGTAPAPVTPATQQAQRQLAQAPPSTADLAATRTPEAATQKSDAQELLDRLVANPTLLDAALEKNPDIIERLEDQLGGLTN